MFKHINLPFGTYVTSSMSGSTQYYYIIMCIEYYLEKIKKEGIKNKVQKGILRTYVYTHTQTHTYIYTHTHQASTA